MIYVFGMAFILFLMQSVGGYLQIQNYKKVVRRMQGLGSVGIGQTRGGLLSGALAIIACDNNGIITSVEVMEGLSFFARFKPKETLLGINLVGATIGDVYSLFDEFDKKKRKKFKAYIQATEALQMRLDKTEEVQ